MNGETKIVWLAAADARGHLMRAHVVRELLASRSVEVHIVTTSDAGRSFLAELGSPSTVLSRSYAVHFDERQNLDRARTEACIARYLLSPTGLVADWFSLTRLASHATLVVNDFHPALLLAPPLGAPVVHVHGTHLWSAIAGHFGDGANTALDRMLSRFVHARRRRALGVIEHTLTERRAERNAAHHLVHPIVAAPRLSPAAVRAKLGLSPGDKLAALYLNPHFCDPALGEALRRAAHRAGLELYALAEGLASRPGFHRCDRDFVSVANAADVLISAPSMGALALSRLLSLPLCALVTDQPEQRRNVSFLARAETPFAAIETGRAELASFERAVSLSMLELTARPRPPVDAAASIARVHAEWITAIEALLLRARAIRRARGPSTHLWRTPIHAR